MTNTEVSFEKNKSFFEKNLLHLFDKSKNKNFVFATLAIFSTELNQNTYDTITQPGNFNFNNKFQILEKLGISYGPIDRLLMGCNHIVSDKNSKLYYVVYFDDIDAKLYDIENNKYQLVKTCKVNDNYTKYWLEFEDSEVTQKNFKGIYANYFNKLAYLSFFSILSSAIIPLYFIYIYGSISKGASFDSLIGVSIITLLYLTYCNFCDSKLSKSLNDQANIIGFKYWNKSINDALKNKNNKSIATFNKKNIEIISFLNSPNTKSLIKLPFAALLLGLLFYLCGLAALVTSISAVIIWAQHKIVHQPQSSNLSKGHAQSIKDSQLSYIEAGLYHSYLEKCFIYLRSRSKNQYKTTKNAAWNEASFHMISTISAFILICTIITTQQSKVETTPYVILSAMIIHWSLLSLLSSALKAIDYIKNFNIALKEQTYINNEHEMLSSAIESNLVQFSIEAKGIAFKKPKSKLAEFVNLNFFIEEGVFSTIDSNDESKKELLLDIISGVEKASLGVINIGGQPVNRINENSVFSHIFYLSKDPTYFEGSIADNLKAVNPNVSDQEILKCLNFSGLRKYANIEKINEKRSKNSFIYSDLLKIHICKIYVVNAKILLIGNIALKQISLHDRKSFISFLDACKGKKSIISALKYPAAEKLANNIIKMDQEVLKYSPVSKGKTL